jgi:hypothetical protein
MQHLCQQNRRNTPAPFACPACERDRIVRERVETACEWALLLLGSALALASVVAMGA